MNALQIEEIRDLYARDGVVRMAQLLDTPTVDRLRRVVETLGAPDQPVIHYHEADGSLGRIEDFIHLDPWLEKLCTGPLQEVAEVIAREPLVLFKEKVNYKRPGGGIFPAHQGAPAYNPLFGQTIHITAMVCIDAATRMNGCIQFAIGRHQEGIFRPRSEGNLSIDPELAAALEFTPIEANAGDVLYFDSYAPHHSVRNETDAPRRALFPTWGLLREGDHRDEYYRHKRANLDDPVLNIGLPFRAGSDRPA